jgi:hypothetical protein
MRSKRRRRRGTRRDLKRSEGRESWLPRRRRSKIRR